MNAKYLLPAVVPILFSLSAKADFLYALSSDTPGSLYTIDTATGAATLVTDLSGDINTSLVDIASLNGVLYADDVFAGSHLTFGTIDPATGAYTAINNQNGSSNWWSLAADPLADLLYAVDINHSDNLVSITPSGTITTIGSVGTAIADLAYDAADDILYGIGSSGILYTINRSTGAATSIGSTGQTGSELGLGYDANNGTLYLNNGVFHDFYSVNTSTGAATLIGSNGVSAVIDGLADSVSAVPEPGTVAMTIAGIAAIVARKWGSARRRRS